jgi:tRNA(adenine34) deaminase
VGINQQAVSALSDEAQQEIDERWMQHAISLAERAAQEGEVPVGAVVVRDNEVIGEAWNRPIGSCDPSAHAEVRAIRAAAEHERNYRLPGTTLYVTIEPCTMCVGALVHARVDRLVFGAREPKAGAVVSQNNLLSHPSMNTEVSYAEGIMADQCSQLLRDFFAFRRKQKKQIRQTDSQ